MKREIKFRGRCINDPTLWAEGSLVTHDDTTYIVVFDEQGNDHWMEVEGETVGQYIGITDAISSREVYEGDIYEWQHALWVIEYNNSYACFIVECIETGVLNVLVDCIIRDGIYRGNIHENPELLEGLA